MVLILEFDEEGVKPQFFTPDFWQHSAQVHEFFCCQNVLKGFVLNLLNMSLKFQGILEQTLRLWKELMRLYQT